MNISFADKASSYLFSYIMSHPQHEAQIGQWLLRFFYGGWQNCCEDDITPDPESPSGRLAYNQQTGTVQTLIIAFSSYDTAYDVESQTWDCREFNWAVNARPVNKYGEIDQAQPAVRLINGGLVNHGDFENPQWSSHT